MCQYSGLVTMDRKFYCNSAFECSTRLLGYVPIPKHTPTPHFVSVVWIVLRTIQFVVLHNPVRACKSSANWSLFQDCVGLRRPRQII